MDVGFSGGFRVRQWPRSLYVGGSGGVSGKAFGIEFARLNAYANRERLRFKVSAGVDPLKVSHTVKVRWENMSDYLRPFSMDFPDTSIGSMGVSRMMSDDGFQVILVPEARRLGSARAVRDDFSPQINGPLGPLSGETVETFTLDKTLPEILLSIEYHNPTTAVASVTLPGPVQKDVVVVTEEDQDTSDPTVLYAVDFPVDEDDPDSTARQMLVTIRDAEAGDYALTFGLPPEQVDLFEYFEVIPVPTITNLTAEAVSGKPGHVALTWQTEPVVANAHYQLAMHRIGADDAIENELAIYGLFEDVEPDDGDEEPEVTQAMRLLPPDQIAWNGESFSIELKLPENLMPGHYRFEMEPVVLEHDGDVLEDPLHGDAAQSSPLYEHTEDSAISPPVGVWALAIGNGLIRVGWTHADEPDEWNVTVLQDDSPTGAVTLAAADLVMGVNQVVVTNVIPFPPTVVVTTNNYLDIGGPDNPLATRNVLELEYGIEYQFDVTAVRKDTGYWSVPDAPIYDAVNAVHDLNIAEAQLHDGTLAFLSPASRASATATEPKTIRFAVFIEDDEAPVASVSLFEEGVPALTFDSTNDIVTLRDRVLGRDTLGVDAFDKIRIEAEIPYERIGVTLRDAEGTALIHLPPINLPELLALDASLQAPWIIANVPAEYQPHVQALVDGNVLDATPNHLAVMMDAYIAALAGGEPLTHGRYQVDVEAYTAENDVTHNSFTINLNALPFGPNLYSLSYSFGHGGRVDGNLSQLLLHGATGTVVTAVATNAGVVFARWSDGTTTLARQDGPVHGHWHAHAVSTTTNGVPIDWYVAHGIAPDEGQSWSELDGVDPHGDGYTYRMAYVAGTNPDDPGSRLRILDIEADWPILVVFDPEVIGRRYALDFRTNLLDGAWELVRETRPEEWDGGRIEHHPSADTPAGYYRIRAIPPNAE